MQVRKQIKTIIFMEALSKTRPVFIYSICHCFLNIIYAQESISKHLHCWLLTCFKRVVSSLYYVHYSLATVEHEAQLRHQNEMKKLEAKMKAQ